MIDNIQIRINEFTGTFINCQKVNENQNVIYFKLFGKFGSSLTITQNKARQVVNILGSIRKWYFGQFSLLDLKQKDFSNAIDRLAKSLEIPLSEIKNVTVHVCEIGLNIRTSTPCKTIIPLVVNYSNLKRYNYENETVGFIGTHKELRIYDKIQQLIDWKRDNTLIKKKSFGMLKEKGYHFLRIEFELNNISEYIKDSFQKNISINFIINNYDTLYLFWSKEISKILISNGFNYDHIKNQKEFALAVGIDSIGFSKFKTELLTRCSSKTINGLKTSRSKANAELISLVKKYPLKNKYDLSKFRIDIAKTLIRNREKDASISLPVLLRNLWG